jgi:hypothetical protein
MNKLLKTPFFLLTIVLFCCFAVDNVNNGFIEHLVKKGESVSLLCIDYYGYYSRELGDVFQKDNPDVKDINLIVTGQTLRFRAPRAPGAAPDDTLFVKKVSARQGVVTCVEGSAALIRKGSGAAENLVVNTVVVPGDKIKTSVNGRVEIIINRETVVRLKEKTTAVIEAYRNSGKDQGKTKVGFSVGAIWTKMKKFQDKISRFELELPNAVAGVHGTVYQTSVNTDSSAEVKVFSGEVAVQGKGGEGGASGASNGHGKGVKEVAGPSEVQGPTEVNLETWVRIVKAMQKISIDKYGKASTPKPFSWDTTNVWESWNRERDERIKEMFGEQNE